MDPNPSQPRKSNRRTVFTKDAGLAVARFAAGGAADAADAAADGPATLTGYALKWNELSDDRGGYKVRLLPGSANFTAPTLALFHHNFAAIIGNTQNGSLRITPDDIGVKVEIDLPNTSTGRDVEELVEKRYVQGMSFAMTEAPKFAMVTEGGQKIMNVSAFTADEVTVTGIPSFTDTSIEILVDNNPEQAPAGEPISAAAKNSSDSRKDRDAHGWKLQKYKLWSIGRVSVD